MPYGPRNESTSREWLLVIAAGITVMLVAEESGTSVAVGLALALVGVVGLAWRLLRNR
ncbi:hypothetical protein H9L10_05100 [Phycicoccus endophyticus]|uniref:Uncharacterized protein n=1 Tax=Phycicoccus endophyticus TaxID=1690220 RepID=A0A7G9R470_9MICO|nr:hypothetical protein [Phycicoccus endophyticus]NHI18246.1 hypothetical protein [Phycicoccus endophyticus]QNN50395.1 hypothetical protein H9L10_05100 [Phycicoccus endophyticus]GGL25255.1 hypothetical protein GCM10012283_04290 [Phycicoccus endophyticus]